MDSARTGEATPAASVLPWLVAALLTAAFWALRAHPLTDGDSCLYGALARDMAAGGWEAWVAPQWDSAGARACFHEHPPGTMWGTALLARAGIDSARAPLAANALWTALAAGGVVALARRLALTPGAALAAGAVFLLHVSPLKYVQRGSLEFPFAACAAWTIVGALRLGDGRRWAVVLAASLGAAFLVKGVFAAAPLAVVLWLLVDPAFRPPALRLAGGLLGAALLVVVFDRMHAAAAGHSFWVAYFDRQVAPSMGEPGTRHSTGELTVGYYVTRTLLYSLPWAILPVVRLVQCARARAAPVPAPAWRLAGVWILVAVAGPALTNRAASRYLFEAWMPAALLFAAALPPRIAARLERPLALAAPALVLVLAVGAALSAPATGLRRTAEILDAHREAHAAELRPVRGPFLPGEDGTKSFLRFHLGVDVAADTAAAPRDADVWVPLGREAPPGAAEIVTTPAGRLVRPRD